MCHGSCAVQAQLQHDSTLRTLLSVYLPQHKLVSQAIKAQFNEGRSCGHAHGLHAAVLTVEGWRCEQGRVKLRLHSLQARERASPCTLTATSPWTAAASAPSSTSTQVRDLGFLAPLGMHVMLTAIETQQAGFTERSAVTYDCTLHLRMAC